MFQTKVVEKIKTRFLCSITFFPETPSVYKIMWKNMVLPDRPQMTNIILRLRCACWITKAPDTHLEYAILYLLLFHGNNGFRNAPQCYVLLPVLLFYTSVGLRTCKTLTEISETKTDSISNSSAVFFHTESPDKSRTPSLNLQNYSHNTIICVYNA
jgi:hypothetical protein